MSINILDCTLRDGGYYNNWNFNKPLVKKYLSSIKAANIDIVEIGFRFLDKNNSLGKFAYSSDENLEQLAIPEGIHVAVMINAQEYIDSKLGAESIEIHPSKRK